MQTTTEGGNLTSVIIGALTLAAPLIITQLIKLFSNYNNQREFKLNEVKQLMAEHRAERAEWQREKEAFRNEIVQLHQTMEKDRANHLKIIENLNKTITTLQKEITRLTAQHNSLKIVHEEILEQHAAEIRERDKERLLWQQEKAELESRILELELRNGF